MRKKSGIYKYNGKCFRYDYEHAIVEHVKDFKTENFNKNAGSKLDANAFGIGYTDGKKFDPTKRLEA